MGETTSTLGWVGVMSQVKHYLRTVGADQDNDGKFLIRGDVVTFLGLSGDNAETVVGPNTVYFRNGQASSLVFGLRSTSYGTVTHVII